MSVNGRCSGVVAVEGDVTRREPGPEHASPAARLCFLPVPLLSSSRSTRFESASTKSQSCSFSFLSFALNPRTHCFSQSRAQRAALAQPTSVPVPLLRLRILRKSGLGWRASLPFCPTSLSLNSDRCVTGHGARSWGAHVHGAVHNVRQPSRFGTVDTARCCLDRPLLRAVKQVHIRIDRPP